MNNRQYKMEQPRNSKKSIIFLIILITLLAAGYLLIKYYQNSPEAEEEYSMGKVTSKDGTTIGFIHKGNGPPLLLIHGTTADHTRWLPVVPYFEKQFTVYAVDRRGRGLSGDSPDYNLMREAEDIAAVIESIDEPVFLLGHSYGAIASLEAALLMDNIKRLILYEPPLPLGIQPYPPGVPEKMQTAIDSNRNEAALEIFFKEVVKMPDYEFEKYSRLPVYNRRIELAPTIPRELTIDRTYSFEQEKFKNLDIPVLLLLGGDSPFFFKEAIRVLNETLPNNKLIVFPGQQHVAMDTNTDLFVKEVRKFLME
jgi:pimeloyl-ACP methyl ester carboxylesterase